MQGNNSQLDLSDERQKEYQRQQEKLKVMGSTANKVKTASADVMIENLLKDSFKKQSHTLPNVERENYFYSELPLWAQCESKMAPAQYKYLWSLVQSSVDLADTQKVSQLLLTSGLHVDVLGFIWSLANKKVPGQLTKQEFYIVLALVGLAQTGCTFNNLNVLKILPAPSVPVLQVGMVKNQIPQPCAPSGADVSSLQQFQSLPVQPSVPVTIEKPRDQFAVNETNLFQSSGFDIKNNSIETSFAYDSSIGGSSKLGTGIEPYSVEVNKGSCKNSNFPCIGSSPTSGIEDEFSEFQSVAVTSERVNNLFCDLTDDFTEFQSANVEQLDPFETVIIKQKREIPKIPLPKTLTGKLTNLKTNILKISPESERKLKVLSQPESLSSLPESKISSTNKVSTSISVLGSNHGIGSRLANHSLNANLERPKHHKHHKIKINSSPVAKQNAKEEIVLGVKTTMAENIIPKCCSKKPGKTFLLKETKIRNEETSEPPVSNETLSPVAGENTRQIEIPMLGTFNETVLPTQKKSLTSAFDLISVQEDKYSALREIQLESKVQNPKSSAEGNDDFGDFLSADISPLPPSPPVTPVSVDISASLLHEEKEGWGEWRFSAETNSNIAVFNDGDTNFKEAGNPLSDKGDLFDDFSLLTLSENVEKVKAFVDANPVPQYDFLNQVQVNSTLETFVFPPKNDNSNGLTFLDVMQNEKSDYVQPKPNQQDELWDLLASEGKALAAEKPPSRQGSLPSLDLKMSSTEESEQEVVWRKCLDSCYTLIQEGFEIFNNVTVKSILDEVFAVPKTRDYLNYLNIAYQISKRVGRNCSELPTAIEDMERLWARLEELCFEYKISLKGNEDNASEGKSQCSICLGYVSQDFIYLGSSSYHPSCANLWVNFVESTLPYST